MNNEVLEPKEGRTWGSAEDRSGIAGAPGTVDTQPADDPAIAVADQLGVVPVLQRRVPGRIGDQQMLGLHQCGEAGAVAVDRDPRIGT